MRYNEFSGEEMRLCCGDCIEEMQKLDDNSIDAVITDPPYGTTACKWDTVIPLEAMWDQLKRITKPNGAIVLTASQPFTSALVMSNPKIFRCEWIWKKEKGGNIATLKYHPSKIHESVLVFGFESPKYYPQMEDRPERNRRNNSPRLNKSGVQGGKGFFVRESRGASPTKYPTSVKEYTTVRGGVHPTQKPVALMEYLIRTYTNKGETVLDFTMGSGTTGVACVNTGRNFIGIERDPEYMEIARQRISEAGQQQEMPLSA